VAIREPGAGQRVDLVQPDGGQQALRLLELERDARRGVARQEMLDVARRVDVRFGPLALGVRPLEAAQQFALAALELGVREAEARHALRLGEQGLELADDAAVLHARVEEVALAGADEADLAGGAEDEWWLGLLRE